MEFDSKETILERYYTLLHWQLAAKLPRPGGVHKYSRGALYDGFTTEITSFKGSRVYVLTISQNINYGAYAMGFDASGKRRTPRGPLERLNFKTIDETIANVSRLVALPTGGKVVIK